MQTLIVMRHGERADTVGEAWKMQTQRPWDPPLSQTGEKQVVDAASSLRNVLHGLDPALYVKNVYSSPYMRCLQTTAAVMKEEGLRQLVVQRGLSESYDGYNSLRYVLPSPDMVDRDGKYKNMQDWFLCCRDPKTYKLQPCRTMSQQVEEATRSTWPPIVLGRFPDFEFYVNWGFNTKARDARYLDALRACATTNDRSVGLIVTHMAGVSTMFQYCHGGAPGAIDTAGYFVMQSKAGVNWQLVRDCLTVHKQAHMLQMTAHASDDRNCSRLGVGGSWGEVWLQALSQ